MRLQAALLTPIIREGSKMRDEKITYVFLNRSKGPERTTSLGLFFIHLLASCIFLLTCILGLRLSLRRADARTPVKPFGLSIFTHVSFHLPLLEYDSGKIVFMRPKSEISTRRGHFEFEWRMNKQHEGFFKQDRRTLHLGPL